MAAPLLREVVAMSGRLFDDVSAEGHEGSAFEQASGAAEVQRRIVKAIVRSSPGAARLRGVCASGCQCACAPLSHSDFGRCCSRVRG